MFSCVLQKDDSVIKKRKFLDTFMRAYCEWTCWFICSEWGYLDSLEMGNSWHLC